MSRTVITEPEVLGHAIRDALNTFTREIVIGRNLVDDKALDILESNDVRREINLVIETFVNKWKTCIIEDK